MMERKDMTVIEPTEPFINLYYNGPERRSDRNLHAETAVKPWRLQSIVKLMLANVLTPYAFSKNMAYYLDDRFDAVNTKTLLQSGINTFIIRDPRAALPSHYKEDHDFNKEEAGYVHLRKLFDIVTGQLGQPPIVIDGDNFCRQPEVMMRAFCQAVGIPYDSGAMTWEAGQVKSFDGYAGWTEAVEASKGFLKPPDEFPDLAKYPPHIAQWTELFRKDYEYLLQYEIKPVTDVQPKPPGG